jgi:hypothetical protein
LTIGVINMSNFSKSFPNISDRLIAQYEYAIANIYRFFGISGFEIIILIKCVSYHYFFLILQSEMYSNHTPVMRNKPNTNVHVCTRHETR